MAFQVDDQKEELKGAEVNIETTQKETAAQSETQITLEQKETSSSHDEISSSVKGKLKKRITKQVNISKCLEK